VSRTTIVSVAMGLLVGLAFAGGLALGRPAATLSSAGAPSAPAEPAKPDLCGPSWYQVPAPPAAAPGTVCCMYESGFGQYATGGPACFSPVQKP
jgi:hypothetical protein